MPLRLSALWSPFPSPRVSTPLCSRLFFSTPQRAAAPASASNPSHRFLALRSPATACWGLSHSLTFWSPPAPLSRVQQRQQQQQRSRRRHHQEPCRLPYSFMKASRHRPQRSAAQRRTGQPAEERRGCQRRRSSGCGDRDRDPYGRPARLQRKAQTSCQSAGSAIRVSASVPRPCG